MRFILILVTLLVLNLEAKSLFSNVTQKANSSYIKNLKELIISTQKTRGMTNAYLNGNTSMLISIYENRSDIKKAIGKMESIKLASDPVVNNRATDISKALIKLNVKAFKQNSNKTFADYTEQIQNMLMLAQTVSKRNTKKFNPFAKAISTIMMETMLPLTEYVGQLRGFGSGLAAKGEVGRSDIEKIYLLVHEVTSLNDSLQAQMTTLLSEHSSSLPNTITQDLTTINKLAKEYALTAKTKLLQTPEEVDSYLYFEQGTDLISSIIKVYDSSNEAITKDSEGWL